MSNIPIVGERDWDVWQSPERVAEVLPALGDAATVFGGEWPDWLPEFSTVLDVGCGAGVYCPRLSERGAYYMGIDTSEAMVEEAQRRYPEATFVCEDMFDLPNTTYQFDLVFSNAVLIHLPFLAEPLAAMWSVARRWLCFNLYAYELQGWSEHLPSGEMLRVWCRRGIDAALEKVCWPAKSVHIVERSPVEVGGREVETLRYLIERDTDAD